MTDISLNSDENALLEKGLKHNTEPKQCNRQIKKHMLEVENAILKTDPNHQDEIRTLFINNVRHTLNNNQHQQKVSTSTKTITDLKNKLANNNAIITKADKGNTTVIILNSDYNSKIDDYISANNIQCTPNDPTKQFHKNINHLITRSKQLLDGFQIRRNKMIKPTAPIITGLPKIHKPNIPIRPLINFTTSPTYKIAKFLNQWLTANIKLVENRSVKNNIELVNKIRNINIPNGAKLASFDVTNMYTNIPVIDTLRITKQLLIDNKIEKTKIDEVIELLTMVTQMNYFQHNNRFYTQKDGLPMGSPLSGTLADIYLNNFERLHVHSTLNKYRDKIIYWYRYVDDILFLFQGTQRQLNLLHNYLNNIHNNINFTLELETNSSINFLDLTIKNVNHTHTFSIYRKPTQTDHTIHSNSYHPPQHKIAAYHHMIHRLNNIPMKLDDYNNELNTIIYIAVKNGYSEHTIHQLNRKFTSKMNIRNLSTLQNNDKNDNKYITIEYNHNTNYVLQRIFRNFGYNTAFKTVNKLQQKLKSKQCNVIDCGLYKINCNDCTKFYIGQTGRTFKQRFTEHISEVNNARSTNTNYKSLYAQHLATQKHTFNSIDDNLNILHRIRKGSTLDRIEEFEIYKNRYNPDILNEKINTKTNKLYDMLIKL